jgi:hypothetical protein
MGNEVLWLSDMVYISDTDDKIRKLQIKRKVMWKFENTAEVQCCFNKT